MQSEIYPPQELLQRASQCLEEFPPKTEVARKFFEKCLEQHPEHCEALESFADFLLRFSPEDRELARQLLERAIELSPHVGAQKYLSLGQVSDGQRALNLCIISIGLLQQELQQHQQSGCNSEARAVRRQISSAKCTVAELYMTDLCEEENAREECLRNIKEALSDDPTNFEAHHIAATFHKVTGEHAEGEKAANTAMELLRQTIRQLALRSPTSDGGIKGEPLAADWELPGAEVRTNFCKTLIDLLMLEEAAEVASGLIEEDDENVAFWHLMAIICMLEGHLEDSLGHIAKAEELISSGKADKDFTHTFSDLKNEVLRRSAASGQV